MGVSVREIVLKEGGVSFSVDIYFKGQRKQVKTAIQAEKPKGREYQVARRQAEAKAADLEAQLKIDPAAVFLGKDRLCTDFIEYFEKMMIEKKYSYNIYQNTLKHLRDFNGKRPLPMANISEVWGVLFRAYIDSLSLSETTKGNYLTAVKIILKKATKEHLVPDFTRNIVQFENDEVPLKYLTLEQIKTLEITPCNHLAVRAAFLFSCFTGLRISDLQALQDSDIRQDGDRLTIRFKVKKTQRWEYLTLGTQALKYLEEAKSFHKDRSAGDNRIFLLPGLAHCLVILHTWGNAAGIPFNLSFHCGRHSFAVMSIKNKVDLYTLSKLMGHKSVKMTEIYARVQDDDKVKAMDKLPSW